jgi:hypothetical protein
MHELRASWTRALALNPNFAHAWIHGGLVRVSQSAGSGDQQGLAIEALQYAMRLSPFGSPGCFPGVAINATCRWTRSTANAGSLSLRPAAQRELERDVLAVDEACFAQAFAVVCQKPRVLRLCT